MDQVTAEVITNVSNVLMNTLQVIFLAWIGVKQAEVKSVLEQKEGTNREIS
jgi:hypothetical protein